MNDFFKKTDNVHNIENTITDTQFLNEPDVIEFFEKTIYESNKKKENTFMPSFELHISQITPPEESNQNQTKQVQTDKLVIQSHLIIIHILITSDYMCM